MAPTDRDVGFSLTNSFKKRDSRRSTRRKAGAEAWVRLDGAFALRPCTIIDISSAGVQIAVSGTAVPDRFSLLMTRGNGRGQACQVKWRRGSQIGAAFV